MSLLELLESSSKWFAWAGLVFAAITLISFIINWGAKFRLVGATVFTLLLSASSWAFSASYTPPFVVEGAQYAPVVYDNGNDLVIAQASKDFPDEAIQPTLDPYGPAARNRGRTG